MVNAGNVTEIVTNRFNPDGDIDSQFLFLYTPPCDESHAGNMLMGAINLLPQAVVSGVFSRCRLPRTIC